MGSNQFDPNYLAQLATTGDQAATSSGGAAITLAVSAAIQAANLIDISIIKGGNNPVSKDGNQPVNGPWRPTIWANSDPTGSKARYALSFPGNYKESGSSTTSQSSDDPSLITLDVSEHLKTSVVVFDAIMRASFDSQLRITEYPVQSGQMYANTAVLQPIRVNLEIGMSDALDQYIVGSFGSSTSKSVAAFKLMCELQQYRVFCTLTSIWGVYYPMLLESVSMSDDASTFRGAKFTATFRQVFLATVAQQSLSSRSQTTQDSGTGTSNGIAPSQKLTDNNVLSLAQQVTVQASTVKTIAAGVWSSVATSMIGIP